MKNCQILGLYEAINLEVNSKQLFQIEGWIVGSKELALVDNPENPTITIKMPEYVYKEFPKVIPGRVWAGGRYLWLEKAQVIGTLHKSGETTEFDSVESVNLSEAGHTLEFSS